MANNIKLSSFEQKRFDNNCKVLYTNHIVWDIIKEHTPLNNDIFKYLTKNALKVKNSEDDIIDTVVQLQQEFRDLTNGIGIIKQCYIEDLQLVRIKVQKRLYEDVKRCMIGPTELKSNFYVKSGEFLALCISKHDGIPIKNCIIVGAHKEIPNANPLLS